MPLDPGPPVAVTSTPRESTAPRRSANVTAIVGAPGPKWSAGTCSVTQRKSVLPGQARSGAGSAGDDGTVADGGAAGAATGGDDGARCAASAAARPSVSPPTRGPVPRAPPATAVPATRPATSAATTASTRAVRARTARGAPGRRPGGGHAVSTAHGRTANGYGA
jgi:hypothetical protein